MTVYNKVNKTFKKKNYYVCLVQAGFFFMFCCMPYRNFAQYEAKDSIITYIENVDSYVKSINFKAEKYADKIDAQSLHYLKRLDQLEHKLHRKLKKIDSSAASSIFSSTQTGYAFLIDRIKLGPKTGTETIGKYDPKIDSMVSSLKFLQTHANFYKGNEDLKGITGSLSKLQELQNSLALSEEVTQYIRQRRSVLKDQLSKYEVGKYLKKINKQVFYYNSQISEYKELLYDNKKIEAKTLELLSQLPAYKSFMKKHSMLAALFPAQGAENSLSQLEGLQEKAEVEQQMQQRLGSSNIDPGQITQQQLDQAKSELGKFKEKLIQAGGNTDLADMPDFKPNAQKTKSFLKRIELGGNIQTEKSSQFLPSTADLGLSAGYKLNDKNVIGFQVSYKLGVGNDIRRIRFTHEGIGLRSFIDMRIKGGFWVAGGAEMNYRVRFTTVAELQQYAAWQRSALLGVSKRYKISNKMKGNLQLMYDFLHMEQLPKRQPLVFRMGYVL